MNSPGQYASQDGSFARSAGGAAGRGLVLIVVAVIIGLVLLAKGFDGADSTVAGAGTDDAASDETADDGDDAAEPADDTADDDTAGEPAEGGDESDDTATDTTDPSTEPGDTRPPSEVKVAVVNGTGVPGLASTVTGILDTSSYVTAAKNAASFDHESSTVYYVSGYAEDAKAVAAILSIPADLISPTEAADVLALIDNNENVADFHLFVFQGADGLADG